MRIIAGRYRHRVLHVNPGMTTRPITDRAKVRLFDHLHNLIPGRRTLDVFSGTGSLGLEALSRGATSVVFLEQDHKAFELLSQNVRDLKAENEVLCWRTDALRSSYKPRTTRPLFPYDLIFYDPPYAMLDDLHPGTPLYKSLVRLAKADVTSERALLVLRGPEQATFRMPDAWLPDFQVHVGSMLMHVFARSPDVGIESTASDITTTEDIPEEVDPPKIDAGDA